MAAQSGGTCVLRLHYIIGPTGSIMNMMMMISIGMNINRVYVTKFLGVHIDSNLIWNEHRPCSYLYFYPTRVPFANGTRRVARVHTASTASGSSGTLIPHRKVFSVDANGTRRVGVAV